MDEMLQRVSTIYKKMSHAAMRADRGPETVRLVAVSKNFDSESVVNAISVGLRDFGENRIQEAQSKIDEVRRLVPEAKVRWHLVGHLQKNKAKRAVELFDTIHSLDSSELAAVIDRHAADLGKIQRVLLQVKLSEEESKYGIDEGAVNAFLGKVRAMKHLKVEGLMTVPPYFEDPEAARPYFRRLREIRQRAEETGFELPELSMGMSHDFEVAIGEGATMVRIGTAIFGERSKEAL